MHNFTVEDIAYFSDDNNWTGGRGYELRFIFPAEYPRESFGETLLQFSGLIPLESQPDNPHRLRSILPLNDLPKVGLIQSYGDINADLSECTLFIGAKQFARTIGSHTDDRIQTMDRIRLSNLHVALFAVAHAVSMEAPVLNATICFEDWGWLLPTESQKSISISTKIAKLLELAHTPVISSPWLAVVEALA